MAPKSKYKENEFLSKLPASKGKVVIAVVLIAVMALMWAKVFFNKGPATANAQATETIEQLQQELQQQNQPQVNISFVDLPYIKGKNDVLKRDVFKIENIAAFPWSQPPEKGNVEVDNNDDSSQKSDERIIREIADKLTVEAISTDKNGVPYEVFIQNKVLKVGSILPVKYKGSLYEFNVIEIQKSKVVLGWNECTVTLKMSEVYSTELESDLELELER